MRNRCMILITLIALSACFSSGASLKAECTYKLQNDAVEFSSVSELTGDSKPEIVAATSKGKLYLLDFDDCLHWQPKTSAFAKGEGLGVLGPSRRWRAGDSGRN